MFLRCVLTDCFTILEYLSIKTKSISRQTPSGHNAYDKKGEIIAFKAAEDLAKSYSYF